MKKLRKDSKHRKVSTPKKRQSIYLKKLTIAVFGDAGVGKSSLIHGFCDGTFSEEYEPTIEDFFTKHLLHNDKTYQIDIIDTCGSDNFPAMRKVDIEKADAIILVFSSDRKRSFEQLLHYREEILEVKGSKIPVVVVANKSDLTFDSTALQITDKHGRVSNARDIVTKKWRYLWTMASSKLEWTTSQPFLMLLSELQRRKEEAENIDTSPKLKRTTSWLHRRSFGSALSLRKTKSGTQ